MKINKKGTQSMKTFMPKKNLGMVAIMVVVVVALFFGIWYGLSNLLATENYYVLNVDVPARTQITSYMLEKVEVSKGGAPQNALNVQQVQQGLVFSKIPLKAGDVLTPSNTGVNLDTSTGIPDDWVVTSFNISADDSVGGNISRGDYFDLLGVNAEGGAKYLYHNILVLDRHFNEASSTLNSDGKVVTLGSTIQYVIGMPANEVAKLHHAFSTYDKIKMVMSPSSLAYKKRSVENLKITFTVGSNTEPVDLYNGTDANFTPVLRDSLGQPVTPEYCLAGKISPSELCEKITEEIEEYKKELEKGVKVETPVVEEPKVKEVKTDTNTTPNQTQNDTQNTNQTQNTTQK